MSPKGLDSPYTNTALEIVNVCKQTLAEVCCIGAFAKVLTNDTAKFNKTKMVLYLDLNHTLMHSAKFCYSILNRM